jgi:hypothetical protein
MREVFEHRDLSRVGYYKAVLDEAGIPSFIRNEHANAITELPSPLFFPVLCVLEDADYDRAMEVLGEIYYATPSAEPDWECAQCHAVVPGNFASCWKCGAMHDPALQE